MPSIDALLDTPTEIQRPRRVRALIILTGSSAIAVVGILVTLFLLSAEESTREGAAGADFSEVTSAKWVLMSINGRAIAGGRAFVQFSPGGDVAGNDSCNGFSSAFIESPPATLTFSDGVSSAMGCALADTSTSVAMHIVFADGAAQWSFSTDTLTISRDAVTLSFVANVASGA